MILNFKYIIVILIILDNLFSIERKIRRRLKWKLLFQEIQNATHDSHNERIADIEDLEVLIDTSKEIKSNKKGVSVSIRSKIKKFHWKITQRHDARQAHSKSFIPEILLKNNERSEVDAKNNIFKNVSQMCSRASLKEFINYCNVSCPNISCKFSSKLLEVSHDVDGRGSINKTKEVTRHQIVKVRKEKKSLLQIVDNLHINNSLNKKNLSNLDNAKDVKKDEYKKQDNSDVQLILKKNNNSSGKEHIAPNKIKALTVKQQKDEASHHNLIVYKKNSLNSEQKDIGNSPTDVCSDVVNKQKTILLIEQQVTVKSNSCSYKLYTDNVPVNEESIDGKDLQKPCDKAFKVPSIPVKKTDNVKKGLCGIGVVLNRTSNLSVDNDQGKLDFSTVSSINRTRILIETLAQNLSFKQSNLKFGLNDTKSEICLSQSDQRYVYKFAEHINGISRYNDVLSIVNYVEQQSPDLTKYILGVTVLEAIGRTTDSKYKYLVSRIKKKVTAISINIPKNYFEIYKEYVLWLFEAKRKR